MPGRIGLFLRLAAAGAIVLAAPVSAGEQPTMAEQVAGREVITLWPGGAPGTPATWVEPERFGENSVTFVTEPTLTVFRPEEGKASGAAVVVAAGGGFTGIAMRKEGYPTARWFADRGITAFVLKYRVRPFFEAQAAPPAEEAGTPNRFEPNVSLAKADGMQAMKLVRANAGKYGIDSDRVGFIGFSAGAMTAMNVTLAGDAASRPDFVMPIYGGMPDVPVPSDAPRAFIVVARDDFLFERSVDLFQRWAKAERPVEFHVYEKGGHGFGMDQRGIPVDKWPDTLERWLIDHGLMERAQEQ